MTLVSFYVLKDPAADRLAFACRLLEKGYEDGRRSYAHLPDPAARQQLDERLWTFKQGSFLPHDQDTDDTTSPIVIGAGDALPAQRDVLVNLDAASALPPEFFSSFERTVEIVAGSEAERALARQRYAFYRDRGYELQTHTIG